MRSLITGLGIISMLVGAACSKEPAAEQEAAAQDISSATSEAVSSRDIATSVQIDPVTGFRMSDDWQLVRAHCTGCHSSKLITQQRGTAAQWLAMIRWMQKKQNLWQFDPDTEQRIIAYLAENYPPDDARRRAAIPRELMPPNPYATATVN